MGFSNNQALIVGGGSGMGLEAGRLLVEAGASVTLVGRRQEKLDDARETFDAPDNVRTFRCDLTSKEDVDRLIRYIAEEMKDVKYLINAAGVFSPQAFLDHTEEDYNAYLDLNRATFFVTQRVRRTWRRTAAARWSMSAPCGPIRQLRRHLRRRIPWPSPGCIP